jgi:hypothetical protein
VPNSFEENVCENANTLAHVVDHMVVLAHLRRRRSLSGRKGLSGRNAYFPLRRKSEKKRRRMEVTRVIGRCTRRDHGLTERVRSVQCSSQARGC